MSEEDFCDEEESDDSKYDGVDEDLPRIIIESFEDSSGKLEDRIVVLEKESSELNDNSWSEKNVKKDVGNKEDEEVVFPVDDIVSDGERLGMALEEVLGGVLDEEEVRDEDFYKVGVGVGYDSSSYDEKAGSDEEASGAGYDGVVDVEKMKSFAEAEEERRGGRSMLEVAGFRDEEAEKKRKEKRERIW